MKETTIRGEATSVALDNMSPLFLPWTQDPWGRMRPPLSVEAMRMSVELAGATYHMAVERWFQAGWRDITIQVDGDLTTGYDREIQSSRLRDRVAATWKIHQVRSRLRQRNPLGQVAGALRQREKSDTGKVLVMAHPAGDGRHVIAISFMGTGARFYDWFSNFRMNSEDGVHQGFLQLARQFEGNEEAIEFPETAAELGLERLTLRDVIAEAATPHSRFLLWLTGHSQGGALMQVYCHHKLTEDGVKHGNILGYGFASPSVMEGMAVSDPAAYPLFHVLNSDDLVPRMGAQMHLGVCLIYPADEAIRAKCYAWPRDEAAVRNRLALRPILANMVDTPACIEAAVAYLSELGEHSAEDMIAGIGIMDLSHLPIKRFMTAADSRIDDLIRYIRRHAAAVYQSITGDVMDMGRIAEIQAEIKAVIDQIGVKAFSDALMQLMGFPHSCNPRKGAYIGAYPYITLCGVEKLTPAVWRSGHPPVLVRAEAGRSALPASSDAEPLTLTIRRATAADRRDRSSSRRTYSAQRQRTDTRHHAAVPQPGSILLGEKLVRVQDDDGKKEHA